MYTHNDNGDDISITKDKLLLEDDKVIKSELASLYNWCWETIDGRLNPNKYIHDANIIV